MYIDINIYNSLNHLLMMVFYSFLPSIPLLPSSQNLYYINSNGVEFSTFLTFQVSSLYLIPPTRPPLVVLGITLVESEPQF